MANAMDVPLGDEDISKAISDMQNALMAFEDRDWLVWAGKMLMPGVYEDVEIEQRVEEERKREQEREEARQKAEEQKKEEEEQKKQEREEREEEKWKKREK